MLKKASYVAAGIGTGAALSFATEFAVNAFLKSWEASVLSGPTVATAAGIGLYLRGYNRYYSIPIALTGFALLGRGVYYVTRFQKQFEQGKKAALPPEVNSMRAIAQALTPEEKGLKMPGMVEVRHD